MKPLLKPNGIIRTGHVDLNVSVHIDGRIKVDMGDRSCLITPKQAIEMALGILRGLGIDLMEVNTDDLLQKVPEN